jgi:hypothetical protein
MKLSLLGADRQRAFDNIKKYLSSPSVMKALMSGIPFRLYIVVEDAVIRVVLTQVTEGKELIDAKTSMFPGMKIQ